MLWRHNDRYTSVIETTKRKPCCRFPMFKLRVTCLFRYSASVCPSRKEITCSFKPQLLACAFPINFIPPFQSIEQDKGLKFSQRSLLSKMSTGNWNAWPKEFHRSSGMDISWYQMNDMYRTPIRYFQNQKQFNNSSKCFNRSLRRKFNFCLHLNFGRMQGINCTNLPWRCLKSKWKHITPTQLVCNQNSNRNSTWKVFQEPQNIVKMFHIFLILKLFEQASSTGHPAERDTSIIKNVRIAWANEPNCLLRF